MGDCVEDVTNAINVALFRKEVYFPMTQEERYFAIRKFHDAEHPFPGAMASIDGTPVPIRAPWVNEDAFVNRHGYHSLNVMIVGVTIIKCIPE